MFYVYEHIRPDTGTVFYVGKGSKKRAYTKFRNNPYWNNVVNKVKSFQVRFVAINLDEELALLVEKERIDQLRKLGYTLTNLTDGGGGASGLKHTDKAKKGMSDNCCMKRPEVVAKISGAKSILAKTVEYEGKTYHTINDLAEHLGISGNTLRGRIFRGKSEKYGYKILGKTRDLAPLQAAAA
jgi:hypothetical protein